MSLDHEKAPPMSPFEEVQERIEECRAALAATDPLRDAGDAERLRAVIRAYEDAADIFDRGRRL